MPDIDPADIGAVLFDMDGTLVDSDLPVERAWLTWATHYGVDGPAAVRLAHGSPSEPTVRKLLPHLAEGASGLDGDLRLNTLADLAAFLS